MGEELSRLDIVGRLAPSPTGYLHLGHAHSFLLAWWQARSRGGRIILRQEDLDGPRVKEGMVEATRRDLEWLGLDWDGTEQLQSAGLERLSAATDQLLDAGLAYPCVCSRRDIREAQSAPHEERAGDRYPGTCRGKFGSLSDAEQRSGKAAGARFLVPSGPVAFHDELLGEQRVDVEADAGDFLIAKRDGAPSYQLAVVVDDAWGDVSEVVRANDLLDSTPRQILIGRALGLAIPRYWHVPLVCEGSGRRLSKRHDDVSLTELRESGVDPRAIVAWVASNVGLKVERARAEEVSPRFDIRRLQSAPILIDAQFVAELRDKRK